MENRGGAIVPSFLLTSPEGKKYRVSGPEGSTGEQALAQLQGKLGGAESGPKVDLFDTISDKALRGATFGLGNKAQAGLAALMATGINDNGFGENYKAARETQDKINAAESAQYPAASVASEIGGGLAGGIYGAGTKGATALSNSLRSGNFAARVAKGSAAGATSGAAYGAGTADYGQAAEGAEQGALYGAMAGGAIPIIGATAGKIKNAILPKVTDPEVARLAQEALNEGIPLSRSQIGDSKFAKTLASASKSIPLSGANEFADRQVTSLNRAALSKAGITADKATPDVLSKAADDFGVKFNDIIAKTGVAVDDSLLDQFGKIESEATRRLGKDGSRVVSSYIDDILESGAANQVIDGQTYQNTRSALGALSRSTNDSFLSGLYKSMQTALDDAAFKSLPAEGKQQWQDVRKQYQAYKTIERAMTSSGAQAAIGNISPAQLALAAKSGKSGYAKGRGELNDLARIGSAFVKDGTPDSGTAGRLLSYQAMTALPGAAVGAYQSPDNPIGGALAGAAGTMALARGFNKLNTNPALVANAIKGPSRSMAPALSVPAGMAAQALSSESRPAASPMRMTITPQDKMPMPEVSLPPGPQSANPQSQIFAKLLKQESGNRDFGPDGQIIKGPMTKYGRAEGAAQVLPMTQRDPGFGVEPARDKSPQELRRVGEDYFNAMKQRYNNDLAKALIAYNWGPGNTDKWLQHGGDPRKLPQETRDYIAKILGS
jgi:hypothetical protein